LKASLRALRRPELFTFLETFLDIGVVVNARWPLWTWFYCLYGVEKSVRRNTFASAWFCIVHANLSVTAHTASIWITVALSAFRYSMVRRAADGRAATTASAGNNLLRSSSCVPSRALDLDWWLVADV